MWNLSETLGRGSPAGPRVLPIYAFVPSAPRVSPAAGQTWVWGEVAQALGQLHIPAPECKPLSPPASPLPHTGQYITSMKEVTPTQEAVI